jgi:hypothetical protein
MTLIGSTAIKYWFPDFPRNPKDKDWAVETLDGLKSTRETEYLINPIISKYEILSPSEIYTLKMSHMSWDINWKKHLFDIQWLKEKGCVVDKPLFYELYEYWNTFHGANKRSNLKMNASQFFDNALKCEYNHDWLHTLIKDVPTYNKVLFDNAEVEVSEDKFNDLSFEEKCDLVQEEIYVMAWERMPNMDYRFSYEIMMKKFILSHAPIWELIFILDNYKHLYKPKINFKKTIEDGINKSKDIKRIIKKQKQVFA